ncbi:MAG: RNA-binding protein [Cycloclasticus sp. symbiont of Bathymodiolus heckerae]|nr:MAG: RNA-binding protein [Cycloclasticus sp. symbiont of Bathymodiolus heckerae]
MAYRQMLRRKTTGLNTKLWPNLLDHYSLASDAIAGGKIHFNGQRVKPSKEIQVNDALTINKSGYNWSITVAGLNNQRRPASEAVLLYIESEESQKRRHDLISLNKDMYASVPQSERPNKKQRRQIHRFKHISD